MWLTSLTFMKLNKTSILQKMYTDYCKHLKNILFVLDKNCFWTELMIIYTSRLLQNIFRWVSVTNVRVSETHCIIRLSFIFSYTDDLINCSIVINLAENPPLSPENIDTYVNTCSHAKTSQGLGLVVRRFKEPGIKVASIHFHTPQ